MTVNSVGSGPEITDDAQVIYQTGKLYIELAGM